MPCMTCRACGAETKRFEKHDTCETCERRALAVAINSEPDVLTVALSAQARCLTLEINRDHYEIEFDPEAFCELLAGSTIATAQVHNGLRIERGMRVTMSPQIRQAWQGEVARVVKERENPEVIPAPADKAEAK